MSNENIARRGLMLVLSSPSGAGKTTLSRRLLDSDGKISLSVSATTRPMRPGEVHGRDYHFIGQEEFAAWIADGRFLEHASVFGNRYGTPRALVEASLNDGRDVLFDIDWQGTQQLKEKARDDLVSIFILPPSHEELERRLRARAQDSDDVVAGRMAKAADEISHWPEYDYVIVNTSLDKALADIQAILNAERLRRTRQTGISEFVSRLV
ncbi:MAG: guanylate kinase [Alphaproteobacteria bacterium 64-11]|nr:guanylate kinase [Alphaproteobacteria bacterium]OJU09507.1 MAG: guanylate kinase [Alphaproteobacteria bacterium 64-11]